MQFVVQFTAERSKRTLRAPIDSVPHVVAPRFINQSLRKPAEKTRWTTSDDYYEAFPIFPDSDVPFPTIDTLGYEGELPTCTKGNTIFIVDYQLRSGRYPRTMKPGNVPAAKDLPSSYTAPELNPPVNAVDAGTRMIEVKWNCC